MQESPCKTSTHGSLNTSHSNAASILWHHPISNHGLQHLETYVLRVRICLGCFPVALGLVINGLLQHTATLYHALIAQIQALQVTYLALGSVLSSQDSAAILSMIPSCSNHFCECIFSRTVWCTPPRNVSPSTLLAAPGSGGPSSGQRTLHWDFTGGCHSGSLEGSVETGGILKPFLGMQGCGCGCAKHHATAEA